MKKNNKKIDWLTIIPLFFLVLCIGLSVGKMLQTDDEVHILDLLDSINSNTFSTCVSMVICMAYQFFAVYNKKQQERSGLSKKWIALTIIATVIYGIIAVINACRYGLITTVIMTMASVVYVFLFFKFMKVKR